LGGAAGQEFRKWSIWRARIRYGAVGRSFVRGFVIDSMGLSLRVLEGDLMAAVIGSINVDGRKRRSRREWPGVGREAD